MIKRVINFLFTTSAKYKKLFIKENLLTDKEENFTVLFRLINKLINADKKYYVIDIGAFDGLSSVHFSKKCPNNQIIAFEPNERSYNLAIQNTKSFSNIKVHRIALSEKAGFVEFNITKNSVSSSLNQMSEKATKENGYNNELVIVKKVVVETKPLDDYSFDKEILFIKMDTQGNEIRVLEGAKNTLKNTLFVLTEMSNHDIYTNGCKYYEVDNWLRNNGFKLVDMIVLTRKKGILVTEYDGIYANVNKVSL
jgi:FkbM family methyltransferase